MNVINLNPHYGNVFEQEINDFLCLQKKKRERKLFGLNRIKSKNLVGVMAHVMYHTEKTFRPVIIIALLTY